MAIKKKDPFLDALSENTGARANSRLKGSRTRPITREMNYAQRRVSFSFSLDPRLLPIPLQAALMFAVCIGLGTLVAPLMGRFIVGSRGLDNVLASFASETGIGTLKMVLMVPALALVFAPFAYLKARRKVERIGQSISRALLVVLLIWIVFSAWATRQWCLPVDYLPCYSKVVTVTGFLGGGPILLSGLIAGYLMGRIILKSKAQAKPE